MFYPEKVVTYGPGAVAPDEPVQTNLAEKAIIEFNGYELTTMAEFDITARILSTHDYSSGRESALGKQPCADQNHCCEGRERPKRPQAMA